MNRFIFIFLTVFISFFISNAFSFATESSDKISLSVKDQSMRTLTEKIKEQTGYDIFIPEIFYDMKVSGEFKDVTLNELLARVLKGISHSTVTNEEESWIIVQVFSNSPDTYTESNGNIDSESPEKYYAELIRTGKENEARFQEFAQDPNSIDPLSGLSFKELWERADLGEASVQIMLNDPQSIDPFSGKEISLLRESYEENKSESLLPASDPSFIDPSTGRTIQELLEISLGGKID